MQKLLDFDVAIEPFGDGYRARVVTSPVGESYTDFALPFTDQDLEILVLKVVGSIGRARRKARRIQSEERRLLEDFGGQLFQAVFSGPVLDCLGRSRLVADNRDTGLRIRLRLPGALANIPWEYLHDSGYGFLGLSPETVLARYLEMPAPVRPFPISPPLRILAMISAPSDVPELEGEEEWSKLTGALADLIDSGLVQVDRLAAGTLAALQRPLRLSEYHVLHFIGHGGYDEDVEDGALACEGTDGKTRLVTGRDLGLMIRGHRSLRLVVLNACEGARSARDDPFGGVAQALVRQGIPAVIAMQFEISDPAALVFSQSFYQAIADGLPVDLAMVEARRAMFAEGNEVEWATPVLYLRSPDGRVFLRSRVSEADRQARAQAREQAEAQAREEADRQARERAKAHAREEAEAQAREEAEAQAREEAEAQAREQAEAQAREEAERPAREQAEQARELASRYALACDLANAQDWDQAITMFTAVADMDPGYGDVQQRVEDARKQQQIARWQAEARRLHQAGQWAAVSRAGQQLQALDPAAADPEGLVTSARVELAKRQAHEDAERQAREQAERQAREPAVKMLPTTCPGCKTSQECPEGSQRINCSNCGKEIVWKICPDTKQVSRVLSEWTTWTHPGCKISHIGPSVACPGCQLVQQVPSGDTKMNCGRCGKEMKFRRCSETNKEAAVLSEWKNWTHPGCKVRHLGPSVTCPSCHFAQQVPDRGQEWNCAKCGKKIKKGRCTTTNHEFLALSDATRFTHPGCKIKHYWSK